MAPDAHGVLQHGCPWCKLLSRTFGRLLFFVLRVGWDRLEADQVRPHLNGLNLVLVGGLVTRGWTVHDVDVVGQARDAQELERRLLAAGIRNPVHLCNSATRHSHAACIRGGLTALHASRRSLHARRNRVPR